jgi:DNA-binding transcriptional LysR family regulator
VSLRFCTGCISIVGRRESLLHSGCQCREQLCCPDEDIAIASPSQHLQVDVVTSNCPDAGLARDERRGTEMGLNKLSTSQLRRHLCRSQPYAGHGCTTAGGARNKRQADTPPASARRTTSPSFFFLSTLGMWRPVIIVSTQLQIPSPRMEQPGHGVYSWRSVQWEKARTS